MITIASNARMSWVAFATAGVALVSGALLTATFVIEVPFNGPYDFGNANAVVTAVGNILIAALVLHVSTPADRSVGHRVFVGVVAAGSLISALFSLLLLAGVLSIEVSGAASIVAVLLQAVWMIWLNTRLFALGIFGRLLSRCGQFVGAGLVVGLLIVGVSTLFPWLTLPQVLPLALGVAIAGGVWLTWPIWFIMLGVNLRRRQAASGSAGARSASRVATSAVAAPDPAAPMRHRARGRRSASRAD